MTTSDPSATPSDLFLEFRQAAWDSFSENVQSTAFRPILLLTAVMVAVKLTVVGAKLGFGLTCWPCWLVFRSAAGLAHDRFWHERQLLGDAITEAVAKAMLRRVRMSVAVAAVLATVVAGVTVTTLEWPAVLVLAAGAVAVLAVSGLAGVHAENWGLSVGAHVSRPLDHTELAGDRLLAAHWAVLPGRLLGAATHRDVLVPLAFGDAASETLDAATALADDWDGTLGELVEVAGVVTAQGAH